MPRFTLQPSDETCSATLSSDGDVNEVAVGGFPGIQAANVTVTVTAGSLFVTQSGGANGIASVEYTTNGSTWAAVESRTANGTTNAPFDVTITGYVSDLSLLDIRARAQVFLSGGSATATATVTNWEISAEKTIGIIE